MVYFKGNTFTPNDKKADGRRDWKCSQYYKANCKARVVTVTGENILTTIRLVSAHSHPNLYMTPKSEELLFNYR